ncbi:hypothetical protein [uncultured Alistipes sp.]|uniref:DUF6956 domain-containing protein n=1 Tax=uncultured Alistipes sp. TaxID=538949 RepID=UPI0026361695|nr:hypothetical protein [uncultured Alistipes sp.]
MNYETLIITFAEPIRMLDDFFDAPETWGVETLKGWVDNYESTRFTPIDECRAVITSEYNMPSVREWLEYYMPIANIEEM